jgi:hypothetical protein
VEVDLINAAKYYRMAADQKCVTGHTMYGLCLARGLGVQIDLASATRYFKRAADENCAAGQTWYGWCVEEGFGIGIDLATAAKYYRLAANQHYAAAQVRYGRCLEFGNGVAKDLHQACDYYKSAAESERADGQFNFGFCLQHGLGVEIDISESVKYYGKSVASQDGPSESGAFEYGLSLQYGRGLDESLEDASEFYELVPTGKDSIGTLSLSRCLRSMNKFRRPARPVQATSDSESESGECDEAIRPSNASGLMADYLTEPIGPTAGPEIGRGGSSRVKLVRDPRTGKMMAVKYFSGSTLDRTSFIREVESLSVLNHPCVLRIIGWTFAEGSRCPEIHTEFAERGSLEVVVNRRKSESERQFWTVTRIGIAICDIVLGMRFVHFRQLIHRDLKPSNILIGRNGRALIGDFGSSRLGNNDATLTSGTGSVHYAAPELFDESAVLTDKVDVFSFGLILYELLSGVAVFPLSLSPMEILRERRSRPQSRGMIPEECGSFMESLIGRCWSESPSDRPSFDDILRDFRGRQFEILPGVEGSRIGAAVDHVLQWEIEAGVSRPWS